MNLSNNYWKLLVSSVIWFASDKSQDQTAAAGIPGILPTTVPGSQVQGTYMHGTLLWEDCKCTLFFFLLVEAPSPAGASFPLRTTQFRLKLTNFRVLKFTVFPGLRWNFVCSTPIYVYNRLMLLVIIKASYGCLLLWLSRVCCLLLTVRLSLRHCCQAGIPYPMMVSAQYDCL